MKYYTIMKVVHILNSTGCQLNTDILVYENGENVNSPEMLDIAENLRHGVDAGNGCALTSVPVKFGTDEK